MRALGHRYIGSLIKEGFPAITAAILLGTLGGAVLNSRFEALITLPPLLALVPPMSDMAGDFGLVVGARLTTALKLGYIRPRVLHRSKVLRKNVGAVLISGCFAAAYVGLVSLLASYIGGVLSVDAWMLIQLAFLSGLLLIIIVVASGIVMSVLSFKYGLDLSPLITSIGDLSGPVCLILVAGWLQLV